MKLAEALQERADLQTRIAQLRERINQNVLVQEGEQPAEDPEALLSELEECVNRLETLIVRINDTNSRTQASAGNLTALIARRDCLRLRVGAYRDMLNEASSAAHRATRTEIRILSTIPVREYRKQADEYSLQLRELEGLIQSLNWTTELL